MPEWLQETVRTDGTVISLNLLAMRLALSLAFGCGVAAVYFISQRKERVNALPLVTTLVLLTVLIAMATVVIGNNIARAFSLVAALGIVRFRTLVADTRDTAFVIFAVVVGMALGAGYLIVPLVGVPTVILATLVLAAWTRTCGAGQDGTLRVRLSLGRDPESLLKEAFTKHLDQTRLVATSTARQGASLELTYRVRMRLRDSGIPLVTELNRLEGIQGVELREP
jgi:hypothetical protein